MFAVFIGFNAVVAYAQGGISGPEGEGVVSGEDTTKEDADRIKVISSANLLSEIKGAADYLGQVKDLVEQAVGVSEKSKEFTTDVENKVRESGITPVLAKLWDGIKAFLADEAARSLVIDTLKLGLRLVGNIFLIVANVIEKILAAA